MYIHLGGKGEAWVPAEEVEMVSQDVVRWFAETYRDRRHWLEALGERIGRPCNVAALEPWDPGAPTPSSRLLGEALMPLGEPWPRHEGVALTCLLQVRVDELPVVPDWLEGRAWMSLFSTPDILHEGWCLRFYDDLQGMVWRAAPEAVESERLSRWQSRRVRWRRHVDLPSLHSDVLEGLLTDEERALWRGEDGLETAYRFSPPTERCVRATKVGGFPTIKQGEQAGGPSHPDHFDFQLMYDRAQGNRFDLCDCAFTFVGRVDGAWLVESQTS